MADELERLRRKLRFRSARRGTLESDLVIGGFVDRRLESLDRVKLVQLERLLDQNDQEVLGWIVGAYEPPPQFDNDLLRMLKEFKESLQEIV